MRLKRTTWILLSFILFASVPVFGQYTYQAYPDADKNPKGVRSDTDGVDTTQGWDRIWTVSSQWSYSNEWSEVDTIPFPFEFNGQTNRYFMASIGGVVTFDTSLADGNTPYGGNLSLPTADNGLPGKAVMAWGLDADPTDMPSRIATKTYGSSPNRQHWVTFDRFVDNDAPEPDSLVWSIVFEEGSNKIYVVDHRSIRFQEVNLTVGIQIDSTNAIQVAGSPNIEAHSIDDSKTGDNGYYEFTPNPTVQRDMKGHEPAMPRILQLSNAPFNVGGAFRNQGSNSLNSLDVHYRIDGGAVQSLSFSGLSFQTNEIWSFSAGNWNPGSPGVYKIEMWTSNINGSNDQRPSNDTLAFKVNVVDDSYLRKTLIESFSSSHCDPCEPADDQWRNNIKPKVQHYAFIKYPSFGDPYATYRSDQRIYYYNVYSYPLYKFDGQYGTNYIDDTVEFQNHQNEPAYFDIEFTKAVYEGDSVEIRANIHSLVDGEYTYQIAILEKKTTGNVGSNGQTEFHNVMMEMLPVGGTERYFHRGQPNPIIKTGDMSDTYVEEMSDLKAVVFVQNNKNQNVMQAGWTEIQSGNVATSMEESDPEASLELFPNPAEDRVRIKSEWLEKQQVDLRIRDLQGRIVRHKKASSVSDRGFLDVSDLEKGIYFVELLSDQDRLVEKLMVH